MRRRALFLLKPLLVVTWIGSSIACGGGSVPQPAGTTPFEDDVSFLKRHTEIVLLTDPSGAQVAVAPGYQGRVMTSTTGGNMAPSFGWLGRAAIESGKRQPHMNVFGGEDRFWLGPEGGQYSLFFKRGDPFDLDHWQVPEAFDWGAWDVSDNSAREIRFHKRMALTNYSATSLMIDVDRRIRLLSAQDVAREVGDLPGSIHAVAYESVNTVTNAGAEAWRPDSGLVSAWVLGMYKPSPRTTVVLPFTPGPESSLGPIVNDKYFGKVPDDRLIIRNGVLFFRGDGQHRSKIGLPPTRAGSTLGSYDAAGRVLTLVRYTRPPGEQSYVNSMWEIQKEPYKGDVVNSYNDGPPAPGQPPLGPFFELETSSPALNLAPGARYTHVHRTFHLVGNEQDLEPIARKALNVGIDDLKSAFK